MSKWHSTMPEVLLISKAVAPPWNDSSKNLVRDLAGHLERYHARVLSTAAASATLALGRAQLEPVFGQQRSRFAPPMAAQVPVLRRLLTDRGSPLWHFLFAPNTRSSAVARACARLRGRRTVQTVCSAPAPDADLQQVLFGDRVVVLSAHTRRRFLGAGFTPERLVHIPPCVPMPVCQGPTARSAVGRRYDIPDNAPLLVYPGDLEFSRGAQRCLWLLQDLVQARSAHLLLCCRAKTPRAALSQQTLEAEVARLGLAQRVRFVGETRDIFTLLEAADLVLLPAETLFAKMDLPLVLLEAMGLQRAVLVLQDTPAAELAELGGAVALPAERQAWAQTCDALLATESSRRALGEAAHRLVASRFSPAGMAEAYEAVYDELCT